MAGNNINIVVNAQDALRDLELLNKSLKDVNTSATNLNRQLTTLGNKEFIKETQINNISKASTELLDLEYQLDDINNKTLKIGGIDKAETDVKELNTEFDKLQKSIKEVDDQKIKVDGLDETEKDLKDVERAADEANKSMKTLGSTGSKVKSGANGTSDSVKKVKDETNQLAEANKNANATYSNLAASTMAWVGIGYTSIAMMSDMIDKSMQLNTEVRELTYNYSNGEISTGINEIGEAGIFSAEQLEILNNTAMVTSFTTLQMYEALNAMSKSGFDAAESVQILSTAMIAADMNGMELDYTIHSTIGTLNSFGFALATSETAVEDYNHAMDVMQITADETNTSLDATIKGFEYLAPVAGQAGMSFEDAALMLGLLGNAGLDAEKGARVLSSGLLALSAPTAEAEAALKALGVEVYNLEGEMNDAEDIIADFQQGLDGLTDEQRIQSLEAIFGKTAIKSWGAILNQPIEDIERLSDELENAGNSSSYLTDKFMEVSLAMPQEEIDAYNAAMAQASTEAERVAITQQTMNEAMSELAVTNPAKYIEMMTEAINNFGIAVGTALTGKLAVAIDTLVNALAPVVNLLYIITGSDASMEEWAANIVANILLVTTAIAGLGVAIQGYRLLIKPVFSSVGSLGRTFGFGAAAVGQEAGEKFVDGAATGVKKGSNKYLGVFGRAGSKAAGAFASTFGIALGPALAGLAATVAGVKIVQNITTHVDDKNYEEWKAETANDPTIAYIETQAKIAGVDSEEYKKKLYEDTNTSIKQGAEDAMSYGGNTLASDANDKPSDDYQDYSASKMMMDAEAENYKNMNEVKREQSRLTASEEYALKQQAYEDEVLYNSLIAKENKTRQEERFIAAYEADQAERDIYNSSMEYYATTNQAAYQSEIDMWIDKEQQKLYSYQNTADQYEQVLIEQGVMTQTEYNRDLEAYQQLNANKGWSDEEMERQYQIHLMTLQGMTEAEATAKWDSYHQTNVDLANDEAYLTELWRIEKGKQLAAEQQAAIDSESSWWTNFFVKMGDNTESLTKKMLGIPEAADPGEAPKEDANNWYTFFFSPMLGWTRTLIDAMSGIGAEEPPEPQGPPTPTNTGIPGFNIEGLNASMGYSFATQPSQTYNNTTTNNQTINFNNTVRHSDVGNYLREVR